MKYSLSFLEKATGGKILSSPQTEFSGYSCDNREPNLQNHLFIPLVGDNHDAHQYVAAAVEAGVTGVMVHRWDEDWEPLKAKASFLLVDDTLKALQDFAQAWRRTFQSKVLALTGSNGKTTTKDFLFQMLKELSSVNASQGSYNNHWGVPFTLLNNDPQNEYCVVEMGMNHSGEINQLMSIAEPNLVTVTNVGRAHMGNFANGIEGVAAAKEEIYQAAQPATRLLFNIDNDWTRKMYQKYMDRASYTYSTKNFSADVYFRIKQQTEKGLLVEGQIGGVLGKAELSFWGEHNVENLAAAVALAYIGGCRPEALWTVLDKCHCGWGRNQWLETETGTQVLFDGYNANPDSFQQLLKNVKEVVSARPSVAVFGEMLELGDSASQEHQELGRLAGELPWSQVLFVGASGASFAKGWDASGNQKKPIILDTYEETLDLDLLSMVDPESLIIVKGSRGSALERVVERFQPIDFSRK